MSPAATLWSGLRAVALRPPRVNPVEAGPGLFVALIGVYLLVAVVLAMSEIPPPWTVVPYGVTTVLADSLLTLIAAWILVRVMQRDGIVWGVAAILLAATIATSVVVHWTLEWAAAKLLLDGHAMAAILLDLVSRGWWLLVLIVIAHWLAPQSVGRALIAALLAYAVSATAWWWLPTTPVLTTDDADDTESSTAATSSPAIDADDDQEANDDDNTDTSPSEPDFDAEEVMYNQSKLLDAAVAKLKTQTPGVVDLYVVAFAGDAEEDVFRNEAEYAEKLFAQRFNAEGRVLVLENNAATVSARPLATLTNLTAALNGIASKMDPAEDVLLLYVTTHGSKEHELLVDLDPLPLDQIEPDDLADALKTNPGIRWKVLVVNACYSGGFIDALRDDSTLVITSARADRTSFGCGADSDITYFGKAFLAEALNKTTSIPQAFEQAKKSVADWETADKEEHSEPQIASTRSIEAKLDAWQRKLEPRPPVPFAPAGAAQ